jgi:hypothetical protein
MFINYTHGDDIRSRRKKWQVQSFQNQRRRELKPTLPSTDTAHRGRIPKVLPWKQASRAEGTDIKSETTLEDEDILLFIKDETPLRTAIGSLRRDPFNSWPMENSRRLELTVDYCTWTPTASPHSVLRPSTSNRLFQSPKSMLP